MLAISRTTSTKSRPDLWISDGFVVTPSRRPLSASSRISAISAVSAKNFMRAVSRLWRFALGIVLETGSVTRFGATGNEHERACAGEQGRWHSGDHPRPAGTAQRHHRRDV